MSNSDSNCDTRPILSLRNCEFCGVEFPVTSAHRQKRFCSISCSRRPRPMPPKKPCVQCGAEFQPTRKYPQQRFCGHRCQWLDRGGEAYNGEIARATIAQRAEVLRGRGEGKSYPKLNGRHAHRVIAEKVIGRPLVKGEIVHHIDENRLNYSAENLEVLASQSEHMKIHAAIKRAKRGVA